MLELLADRMPSDKATALAGWNAFDEGSAPYTAAELERERQRTRDLMPIA